VHLSLSLKHTYYVWREINGKARGVVVVRSGATAREEKRREESKTREENTKNNTEPE
jgi:hypothetical protein